LEELLVSTSFDKAETVWDRRGWVKGVGTDIGGEVCSIVVLEEVGASHDEKELFLKVANELFPCPEKGGEWYSIPHFNDYASRTFSECRMVMAECARRKSLFG
jgi:hypothetical protein